MFVELGWALSASYPGHMRMQAGDAQAQPGAGAVDEGSALLSAYEQEEALIDTGSSNGNSSPGARRRRDSMLRLFTCRHVHPSMPRHTRAFLCRWKATACRAVCKRRSARSCVHAQLLYSAYVSRGRLQRALPCSGLAS